MVTARSGCAWRRRPVTRISGRQRVRCPRCTGVSVEGIGVAPYRDMKCFVLSIVRLELVGQRPPLDARLSPMSFGGLQPPLSALHALPSLHGPLHPSPHGRGLLAPTGRCAAGRSQAAVEEVAARTPRPGFSVKILPTSGSGGGGPRHLSLLPNITGRKKDNCLVRTLGWQPSAPGRRASLSSPGRGGPELRRTGAAHAAGAVRLEGWRSTAGRYRPR